MSVSPTSLPLSPSTTWRRFAGSEREVGGGRARGEVEVGVAIERRGMRGCGSAAWQVTNNGGRRPPGSTQTRGSPVTGSREVTGRGGGRD